MAHEEICLFVPYKNDPFIIEITRVVGHFQRKRVLRMHEKIFALMHLVNQSPKLHFSVETV